MAPSFTPLPNSHGSCYHSASASALNDLVACDGSIMLNEGSSIYYLLSGYWIIIDITMVTERKYQNYPTIHVTVGAPAVDSALASQDNILDLRRVRIANEVLWNMGKTLHAKAGCIHEGAFGPQQRLDDQLKVVNWFPAQGVVQRVMPWKLEGGAGQSQISGLEFADFNPGNHIYNASLTFINPIYWRLTIILKKRIINHYIENHQRIPTVLKHRIACVPKSHHEISVAPRFVASVRWTGNFQRLQISTDSW